MTGQDRLSSMLLVNIYVRGVTQITANMLIDSSEDGQAADRLYAQRLAMLADPDRFPAIAATIEPAASGQEWGVDYNAEEFLFGLNTVLDGIDALITRRSS